MANITGVNPPVQDDIDYVDKILASFNAIDAHDHSSGKGLQIDSAGLAANSVTGAQLDSGAVLDVHVNASAAIAYSKLALTGAIVNADINASAAIAYSKLALAGSVNLASDVTGLLPVANGGTGSATQNFVDLTTGQSISGLKTFTQDIAFTANTAAFSTGTYNSTDKVITRFTSGTGTLQAITSEDGSLQVLINNSGVDLIVENNANLVTGSGLDVAWKNGATLFFVKANSISHLIGGVGGGSTASDVFTGTTITLGADSSQKFRYTGGSAQSLATLTFADLPDGGRLIVTGSSNTNTLTIPTGLTNVQMNGERVLHQYSTIEFIKDDTQLIEVSRNGI